MHSTGIPSDKLGSVGQLSDGRCFVLFERQTAHSIEKVWQAISDPAQLAVWFPEITLDAKLNGEFKIWFGDDCRGPADVSGRVIEYEPPRVLQFGSMRFELQSNALGCLIRFSDILDFERGRTALGVTNSVLGGWHKFMDALEAHIEDLAFDRQAPEPDYAVLEVAGKSLVENL